MPNEITHKKFMIEFDMWGPFRKKAEKDLDSFLSDLKEKKILVHCGNVVLHEVE